MNSKVFSGSSLLIRSATTEGAKEILLITPVRMPLLFKYAKDRGMEQYKGLSLDTELTADEMITMYRIITGACRQGTETFVNSLGKLKDRYTIGEALEITKGQYGAKQFAGFFS